MIAALISGNEFLRPVADAAGDLLAPCPNYPVPARPPAPRRPDTERRGPRARPPAPLGLLPPPAVRPPCLGYLTSPHPTTATTTTTQSPIPP